MERVMTLMLALAFLGILAIPAVAGVTVDGNVKAELLFSGKRQIEYKRGGYTRKEDIEKQFQNVMANVNVNGDVAEGVEALVEVRGDETGISARQVLIKLTNLIPNAAVRIGHLRIPFDAGLQTSDSADNMENPLIDPDIIYERVNFLQILDEGINLLDNGVDGTMNFSNMFSATLGIFNGHPTAIGVNDKLAYALRGVAKPIQALTITGEYYTSDNTPDTPNLTDKVSAFEIIGQYQALIGNMLTVKGIYGKVTYKWEPIEFTMSYMGVQGSYDINDIIWMAGRFVKGTLDYDFPGLDDLESTEMAIGGGLNIAENTKTKVQYRRVRDESSYERTETDIKTEIVVAF